MIRRFQEIYKYREMLKSFVKKDLQTRYKGSFLGFLWTFANPLFQLLIYSIIFSYLMKMNEQNYALFMFVGMIPWNYTTNCIQGGCHVILGNSNLVTKIYFPREILPFSHSMSGLVNTALIFLVTIPALAFFKIPLTLNLLWLPFLLISQFFLCTGFSLIVSAVNVYFRDLENIVGIICMALYFATPIMYNLTRFPETLQKILLFNPMAGYVLSYRNILYYGTGLELSQIGYSLFFSFAIFFLGMYIFNRLQKNFAEIL